MKFLSEDKQPDLSRPLDGRNRRLMMSNCETVINEILDERIRQVMTEGWTRHHDDAHTDGSMAAAAACYAMPKISDAAWTERYDATGGRTHRVPLLWPRSWRSVWWKPKDRRRDLVRAAALIVAEIERLDRATRP